MATSQHPFSNSLQKKGRKKTQKLETLNDYNLNAMYLFMRAPKGFRACKNSPPMELMVAARVKHASKKLQS